SEKSGLPLGTNAPAFSLHDQTGKVVTLDDLRKKGKEALVFVRSAEWCFYCQAQLVELQSKLTELEGAGIQVAAINYDSKNVLKRFAGRKNITFPLLSDEGSRTIDSYHIRNKKVAGQRVDGIPYPGTMILDGKGVIRAKVFYEGFQERPHSADILQAA